MKKLLILAIAAVGLLGASVSPNTGGSFCSLDANNDGTCEQLSADTTELVTWFGDRSPSGFVLSVNTTQLGAEMAAGTEVTFDQVVAADDEIVRTAGDWTAEGFTAGMTVLIASSTSNNTTFLIDSLDATTLFIAGDTVTDEVASSTETVVNNVAQTVDIDIEIADGVGNWVVIESIPQIAAKGTVNYYYGDITNFDLTAGALDAEVGIVVPYKMRFNVDLAITDVVIYKVGIVPMPGF